jgi:HAD superfamily hydrolase (TIGR01509 family)
MKTILVDAVDAFVIEGEGIYEPLHALLEAYPNRKLILTNADDEQMKKFGLINMPYEVFTLKHNPDKPDPAYFKTMLAHFDLKPEEVVYFEHNPDAVKSAESVGIISYHYDADKRDLKNLPWEKSLMLPEAANLPVLDRKPHPLF